MCLAMNGKRAEINNTSKHVVLVSSPLSVLSSFSLYCYSIASPRSAWHCMPALRTLRSLRSLARFARPKGESKLNPSWHPKCTVERLAPSWPFSMPLELPRCPTRAPETSPRGLQSAGNTAQDAPKTSPRRLQKNSDIAKSFIFP